MAVVLAASALPLTQASGASTPAAPSLSVSTPQLATQGAPFYALSATIDNTSAGSVDHPNSRADFTLTGSGLTPTDLTITYQTTPGSGTYDGTIALTQSAPNVVTGFYGPAAGFDIPTTYKATTTFHVTFSSASPGLRTGKDDLAVHTSLDNVAGATAVSLASTDSVVSVEPADRASLVGDLPTRLGIGGSASSFEVSDENASSVDYPKSVGSFTLSGVTGLGTGTTPNVTLEYETTFGDPSTYSTIPLTVNSNGSLSGTFGPAGGFDFAPGFRATTQFRATFATAVAPGTLTTAIDIGTAAAPTTALPATAADSASTALGVPSLTVSGHPATAVEGTTYPVTESIVNATGSDYPTAQLIAVAFAPGLATGDLTLGYADASGKPASLGFTSLSGHPGYVTAQLPAIDLFNGENTRLPLSLTFTAAAPTGTVHLAYAFDTSTDVDAPYVSEYLPAAIQVITTPGAPTITAVTAGDRQLAVASSAPASTGGSPVTSYATTVTAGTTTTTVVSTTPNVVITGLVDGTTYSVTQRATNAAGTGPVSATVTATPEALPTPGAYKITISSKNTFVPYASRATYTGVLTAGGIPVSNTTVVVTERFVDAKVITVGSATTDANGRYSFTFGTTYSGTVIATAQGATASAPSRVIVTYRSITTRHTGSAVTITAQTRPGFVTGRNRLERVQLLQVDSHGRQVRVLAIANAAQRVGAPGEKHGINTVFFAPHLAPGTYRLEVKVIGTPVNTGAASKPFTVSVS